jgi:hypothetical protein
MATVIESEESTLPCTADLLVEHYFASSIWRVNVPEFLNDVRQVITPLFSQTKKQNPSLLNSVYPTIMTGNIHEDPKLIKFATYIQHTAWTVLNRQGYNMDLYDMFFYDCFGQEHYRYSGHDTHTHPGGVITGFYFVDVPENSCLPVFQDPRSGKNHAQLPERNMNQATLASGNIHYVPSAGDFFFTNSWLPHSFTRNSNALPFRFVHFTLGVTQRQLQPPAAATVI